MGLQIVSVFIVGMTWNVFLIMGRPILSYHIYCDNVGWCLVTGSSVQGVMPDLILSHREILVTAIRKPWQYAVEKLCELKIFQ